MSFSATAQCFEPGYLRDDSHPLITVHAGDRFVLYLTQPTACREGDQYCHSFLAWFFALAFHTIQNSGRSVREVYFEILVINQWAALLFVGSSEHTYSLLAAQQKGPYFNHNFLFLDQWSNSLSGISASKGDSAYKFSYPLTSQFL